MASKKIENIENEFKLPFTGKNYALFAISILFILLGYIVLSTGDISISPVLLVIGYCILLPAAIFAKDKPKKQKSEASE